MSGLKMTGKVIGGVEDVLCILGFICMVAVVIAIVLCRYVIKVSFMQGEEIARYLMIWCGYAGAAYGFRNHAHVGVVVFAEMMPKAWHPYIEKIRHILSAIVVVGVFIFACMCFNRYISSGQLTTATKVPTAFIFSIIPISMGLSIIHTIVDVVQDYMPKDKTPKEVKE